MTLKAGFHVLVIRRRLAVPSLCVAVLCLLGALFYIISRSGRGSAGSGLIVLVSEMKDIDGVERPEGAQVPPAVATSMARRFLSQREPLASIRRIHYGDAAYYFETDGLVLGRARPLANAVRVDAVTGHLALGSGTKIDYGYSGLSMAVMKERVPIGTPVADISREIGSPCPDAYHGIIVDENKRPLTLLLYWTNDGPCGVVCRAGRVVSVAAVDARAL